MKINREDVVQAALIVERYCKEHDGKFEKCECPFAVGQYYCMLKKGFANPNEWKLAERLRNRGLDDAD